MPNEISSIYSGIYSGFSTGADVAIVLVSAVLLYALLTENKVQKKGTNYLITLTILNGLTGAIDMAVTMLEGSAESIEAIKFLYSINFVFSMMVLLTYCLYQYHCMKERVFVVDGITYGSVFVCTVPCIIWLIGNAQANPWFVSFNEYGYHHFQSTYWVVILIPTLVMVFNFFFMLSCRNEVKPKELFAWVSYEIFPIIIYLVFFGTGIYIECAAYMASTLSTLLLYTNTHLSSIRDNIETENELQKSQMQLMVSQIQPHFLYNSLNSIYALIDIDPQLAQEAVCTFSDYLRQNINALKSDKPVRFEEELEHTKAYLYLEQIRFGDKLKIIYDINASDFLIPPLSVQPLVENAIKHGVSKKAEGGSVKIATSENDKYFEISIIDDGLGFEAKSFKDDDKSTHIGIFNVNSRIKNMVSGTLEIKSIPGAGTACTIHIPK